MNATHRPSPSPSPSPAPAPLSPPLTALADLDAQMATHGHAVLDARALAALAGVAADRFAAWQTCWDDLPPDAHLLDGGRYRRRRHGCFVVRPGSAGAVQRLQAAVHRAHWQPVQYNALHGGIERWFEPVHEAVAESAALRGLLHAMAGLATALRGHQPAWFVEAHQFRIDTEGGIGRPTPEGAHRDGVDLVAVVLVARDGVKGGETRVFDAHGPTGVRFTLVEPWSCLLLDDARVIHESTPIQALEAGRGHRDTLVITARAGGFQDPPAGGDAPEPA